MGPLVVYVVRRSGGRDPVSRHPAGDEPHYRGDFNPGRVASAVYAFARRRDGMRRLCAFVPHRLRPDQSGYQVRVLSATTQP